MQKGNYAILKKHFQTDHSVPFQRKSQTTSVQTIVCCSVTESCLTLCDPMYCSTQASLFFTVTQSLLKLKSIESVMASNHLILCRPLLLPSSIFPSIRVFSNESVLHIRWPKYWSFSFNISPLGWYRLDLLVVQATLKSLLQHHSSKASILWRSAFFMAQLSHPYLPKAWKTREKDWRTVTDGKKLKRRDNLPQRGVLNWIKEKGH